MKNTKPLASQKNTTKTTAMPMRRKVVCSKHGIEYESKLTVILGKEIWSSCPECLKERDEKERTGELSQMTQKEQERIQRNHFSDAVGDYVVPKRYQDAVFSNFLFPVADTEPIFRRCSTYVSQFKELKEYGTSLVFSGRVGTGKTRLACTIANELIRTGYTVSYAKALGLLIDVKSTFDDNSKKTKTKIINNCIAPDLLILDEIDVHYGTDYDKKFLYYVISTRYELSKPTILISNLNETDLSKSLGEPTIDRIYENKGTVFSFNWGSFRRRNS